MNRIAMNRIVIVLARLDTCSVCDNERRVWIELPNHEASGIVPCPLCADTSGIGAWLEPYLSGVSA